MAVEVRRRRGIAWVRLLAEARQQGVVAEDGHDNKRDDDEVGEVHHRVLGLPRYLGVNETRGLLRDVAVLAVDGDLGGATVRRIPPVGATHTCKEQ